MKANNHCPGAARSLCPTPVPARCRIKMARIVSLLFASLLTAPAAAEFNLYGQFHAGLSSIDGSDESLTTLSDERDGSRVGVTARQQIADGFAGFGAVELGFDLTDADDNREPVFIRQAFVGLRTAFGDLRAGRMESAYQNAGGTAWDELTGTFLEQRRSGGMSGGRYGHNSFRGRHLEYRTIALAGLRVAGQLSVDDRSEDDGDYNIGVTYEEDAWELAAGYARRDDARSGENRNFKLGARFDTGEAGIAYQYEDVRIRDDEGTVDPHTVADTDDGVDLIRGVTIDSNMRHHMLALHQRYVYGTLWLAGGYQDASDSDFNLRSYTIAWIREYQAGVRWYAGLQHQDRSSGYPDGRLNILSAGVQLRF